MRRIKWSRWAVIVVALVVSVPLWGAAWAAAPGTVEHPILFGKESLGAKPPVVRPDCPDDPKVGRGKPACFDPDHDGSARALDIIIPRTVTIDVGESVTFERGGGNHTVAIYAPGTSVDALKAAAGAGAGNFEVDTPELDRLFRGPTGTSWTLTTAPGTTFDTPGKYLMVCIFRPHFLDLDMYGYVVVKDAR